MRSKPTTSSPLETCKYVFQCECEPRQHARRDRTSFSTRYWLEFVASQCQHAERACVRIDDPVFLHAEASVERSFGIEIVAPCSRRENFHDEIGSSVDGLRANDMEPVLGEENDVGDQEIVQSETDASGGVKNTAEAAVSDESVERRDDIHADNLMLYEGHRRDDQLPVNQLLPVTLMLLGDQLEVFER